jgi:hypothetical protein
VWPEIGATGQGYPMESIGTPQLTAWLQVVPRPDLDPRWPTLVPGRPNVQDMVGLTTIALDEESLPGFWLWDNREHQYWLGYDGSFLPRHQPVDDHGSSQTGGWLSYSCDGVETRHSWAFGRWHGSPRIDVTIDVRNHTEATLGAYAQLVACYHPESPVAQYVDERHELANAPDFSLIRLNHVSERRLDAVPEGLRSGSVSQLQTEVPYLVSAPLWAGVWRHVIILRDPNALGFVTWTSPTFPFRALDYLIGPSSGALPPARGFRTRVTHLFTRDRATVETLAALVDALPGAES